MWYTETVPTACCWLGAKTLFEARLIARAAAIATATKKLACDDPRRVTHSVKVALALTLVSLFYYFQPLYDSFGVSAMWAVITVVVVSEFYVGATLGKGLNRAMATLLAGVLGVGANHLAGLSSKTGQPVIIGLLVFLQALVSTFLRFFPKMKARYDYGILVFMLTFSMISITGVRQDEILKLAYKRVSTILIGGLASLLVSVLVFPVWAGDELHNSVARNIESIGNYLEGFGNTFFNSSEISKDSKHCSVLIQGYRVVLNSKGNEESLANFASWEPPHGKFRLRHPWKQYLRVGALVRQCAYRIDALNAYVVNSTIQGPFEMQEETKIECITTSLECSNALRATAILIRTTRFPQQPGFNIGNLKASIEKLKASLVSASSWSKDELPKLIPVATLVTLLVGVVECIEEIVEAGNELAHLAHFKNVLEQSGHKSGRVNEQNSSDNDHIAIAVSTTVASDIYNRDVNTESVSVDMEMNGQNVEA